MFTDFISFFFKSLPNHSVKPFWIGRIRKTSVSSLNQSTWLPWSHFHCNTISSARRDGQRQICVAPGPGASSAAGHTPLCSTHWRGSASEPAHRVRLRKAGGPAMPKTSSQTPTAPPSNYRSWGLCGVSSPKQAVSTSCSVIMTLQALEQLQLHFNFSFKLTYRITELFQLQKTFGITESNY